MHRERGKINKEKLQGKWIGQISCEQWTHLIEEPLEMPGFSGLFVERTLWVLINQIDIWVGRKQTKLSPSCVSGCPRAPRKEITSVIVLDS
jgi:hypothetical protein